jgi:hypothetical protein
MHNYIKNMIDPCKDVDNLMYVNRVSTNSLGNGTYTAVICLLMGCSRKKNSTGKETRENAPSERE